MSDQEIEALRNQVDELYNMIGVLRGEVDSLSSELRRTADLAQNAEYMASDAKREAEAARNASQRGW